MLKMLSGAGIMFAGVVLGYAMREASEPESSPGYSPLMPLSDAEKDAVRARLVAHYN
jgi:hypothetical protein